MTIVIDTFWVNHAITDTPWGGKGHFYTCGLRMHITDASPFDEEIEYFSQGTDYTETLRDCFEQFFQDAHGSANFFIAFEGPYAELLEQLIAEKRGTNTNRILK